MLLSSILPSIAWCGFETYSPIHTVSSFRIHSDTKYKYINFSKRPPATSKENVRSMRLYICSSFSLSFRKTPRFLWEGRHTKKVRTPSAGNMGVYNLWGDKFSLSFWFLSLSFSLFLSLFLPSFLLSLSFSLSLFFSLSLGFSLFCPL